MAAPATVRNHNTGAMWPGPSATKFGATASEHLNDGHNDGAGNEIACFPDDVHGAAAQFDLLQRVYVGMTVHDAIKKWTSASGEDLDGYLNTLNNYTGLEPDDRLTRQYIAAPKTGIAFAKGMARAETGYEYPMSDADWLKAHDLVFGDAALVMVGAPDDHRPATLGERILHRALSHMGETETSTNGQHDIVEWAHNLGRTDVESSDFPWCADFTGAMMALEGAQVPQPDDALLARSYLNVGKPVFVADIAPGDIAIWPRGNGMGHVNIVETVDHGAHTVTCIGGNQNDMVSRASPRNYTEALGFRQPVPSNVRPNGTKSVVDTISESPSLKMHLQALGSATLAGVIWLYNSVSDGVSAMIGNPADTAHQVDSMLTPTKQMVVSAGIPLTAKVLFALSFGIFCLIGWRLLSKKQTEPQRQTVAQPPLAQV